MEKPLVLKLRETEEQIVKIINESKVPNFVLKNSIEKIYNQIITLEQKEYEIAKQDYEKSLKEGKEKNVKYEI